MFYATLEFKDRKDRRFRTISNFSDALLLTVLAGVNLYILKKIADEIDDFKDWTYCQEVIDSYEDEDD